MTQEEVCKGLSLVPPDQYFRETGKGKTTSMIIRALAKASDGRVIWIKGHTVAYTKLLVELAQHYADPLGIDPDLIHMAHGDPPYMYNSRVFVDHYDKPINFNMAIDAGKASAKLIDDIILRNLKGKQ